MAGQRVGRRLLAIFCKISVSPDSCVRQSENLFTRIGPPSLLFAKFVPGLGTIAIVLSGIVRVALPLFFLLDLVGVSIYFGLPIVLGYVFRDAIETLSAARYRLQRPGIPGLFPGQGRLVKNGDCVADDAVPANSSPRAFTGNLQGICMFLGCGRRNPAS